jgi:hypothetical protein
MILLDLQEMKPNLLEITDECEQIDCEDCMNRNDCEPYKNGVNDLAFL